MLAWVDEIFHASYVSHSSIALIKTPLLSFLLELFLNLRVNRIPVYLLRSQFQKLLVCFGSTEIFEIPFSESQDCVDMALVLDSKIQRSIPPEHTNV